MRPRLAPIAAIFVFLLGCLAIFVLSTLAGAWRAASEEEKTRGLAIERSVHATRNGSGAEHADVPEESSGSSGR